MASESLFPLYFVIKLESFDQLVYTLYNSLWLFQICLALVYCIATGRYLPTKKTNQETNILLSQINCHLFTIVVIYAIEMYYEQLHIRQFDRFLHHLFSILASFATFLEFQIMCFWFLAPLIFHAAYWIFIKQEILLIYNVLILIATSLFIYCHVRDNRISLRVPLLISLVFNSNIMGYLYDFKIDLSQLDEEKFKYSVILSCGLSAPFYIYLIYLSFRSSKNKTIKQS